MKFSLTKLIYKYFHKLEFNSIDFIKKKTIVYRIETIAGDGPYYNFQFDELEGKEDIHQPLPNSDFKDFDLLQKFNFNSQYIFGFRKKEDIYRWFDKNELIKLKNNSFLISFYLTEQFLISDSDTQIIFNIQKSELIKEEKIKICK